MNNQYRVGKPKEGMNTLVARFSFTLFDKSVEKIKMLRRQGESEDQILEHIKDAFRHADEITRKNIHQLALGLTPRDDISATEVARQVEVKAGTLEVELSEPREDVEAGAVVFYDGKRWVVASSKGSSLILKLFDLACS